MKKSLDGKWNVETKREVEQEEIIQPCAMTWEMKMLELYDYCSVSQRKTKINTDFF